MEYKEIIFHVLPVNDEVEHTESKNCWCKPHIEENGRVIIHNSFDGREDFEEIVGKEEAT